MRLVLALALALGLAFTVAACGRDSGALDAAPASNGDANGSGDGGAAADALGALDSSPTPIADASPVAPDSVPPADAPAPADARPPADAPPPPPGLSVPCSLGPGWAAFRFHYDPGHGTNAVIDVWDATCSYSLAPDSICNVVPVGSVGTAASGQAIALDGSDYVRVRFSVTGLSFSGAAVYLQARSLSTSASTTFQVWSPLYGDAIGGPVDNDFTYDWYGVDWTGYLSPDDPPSLTAIQLYPYTGSGALGIHAVELCVTE